MARHVADMASQALQGSGASAGHRRSVKTTPRLTARQVDRVFMRMATHFGTRWTGRFGSDELLQAARAEWSLALGHLSDDDLNRGFQVLAAERRADPPSLGEFRGMCREYAHASHRPVQPALPAPRNRDKAAKAVQGLRDILEGKGG